MARDGIALLAEAIDITASSINRVERSVDIDAANSFIAASAEIARRPELANEALRIAAKASELLATDVFSIPDPTSPFYHSDRPGKKAAADKNLLAIAELIIKRGSHRDAAIAETALEGFSSAAIAANDAAFNERLKTAWRKFYHVLGQTHPERALELRKETADKIAAEGLPFMPDKKPRRSDNSIAPLYWIATDARLPALRP